LGQAVRRIDLLFFLACTAFRLPLQREQSLLSADMMRNLTVCVLLASMLGQAAAWDMPKVDMSWPPKTGVKAEFESPIEWPLQPKGSLGCKWDSIANGVKCALDSTANWPTRRTNALSLEKKIGSVCCKVTSPAEWPLTPTGSVKGSVDVGEGASMCYDLKSPINLNGDVALSGTVSLEKTIGSTLCSLETPPQWPMKPKGSMKHTFDTSVGNLCCTVESPMEFPAKPKATISRTFETDVGSICCKAKTDLTWPPEQPSGTVTLKKKMGAVCANLEATSGGKIKCTFDSSWDGVRAAESSDSAGLILPLAAFGLAAGSAFAALRLRRRPAASLGKEPLLEEA
jgi:hypothetical protein